MVFSLSQALASLAKRVTSIGGEPNVESEAVKSTRVASERSKQFAAHDRLCSTSKAVLDENPANKRKLQESRLNLIFNWVGAERTLP